MKQKISVIVPVYNASKYIERVVNCVLNQSYSSWELIMVDDGSSDGSSEMLDKIQATDDRIIVIHQQNAGPGMARNSGLEKATGFYTVFLDVDDYIDVDYFRTIAKHIEFKTDVLFIDVMQVRLDGTPIKLEPMSIYKNLDKDDLLRSMMTGKAPWGGVRKVVRTEILNKYNIRYSCHKIGEEALFSFQSLYNSRTVSFLDEKPYYFYELHEDSQSNIKVDDPWGEVVLSMKEYLLNNGLYEKFANTLNAFAVSATVVALDRITQNYPFKLAKGKLKERVTLFNQIIDRKHDIDTKHLVYKARVFIPFLLCDLWYPVYLVSKLRKIKKYEII